MKKLDLGALELEWVFSLRAPARTLDEMLESITSREGWEQTWELMSYMRAQYGLPPISHEDVAEAQRLYKTWVNHEQTAANCRSWRSLFYRLDQSKDKHRILISIAHNIYDQTSKGDVLMKCVCESKEEHEDMLLPINKEKWDDWPNFSK